MNSRQYFEKCLHDALLELNRPNFDKPKYKGFVKQWRHWTGCEGPQDVTAVIVELYEGEIVEMWVSSSGTYFLNGSHWEPVPTQYWA